MARVRTRVVSVAPVGVAVIVFACTPALLVLARGAISVAVMTHIMILLAGAGHPVPLCVCRVSVFRNREDCACFDRRNIVEVEGLLGRLHWTVADDVGEGPKRAAHHS